MAVNGQTTQISRADVREVGDRFGVPGVSDVLEQVLTAVEGWPEYADAAGVPETTASQITLDILSWSAPLR
jgi:serine/threonine-protein kinase HipA